MITIHDEPKLKHKFKLCRTCNSKRVNVFSKSIVLDVRKDENRMPVKYLLPKVECLDCGSVGEAIEGHGYVHDATCISRNLPTPAEFRCIIRKHNLNVVQLAKLLGVDKELVKKWESGEQHPSRAEEMLLRFIQEKGVAALMEIHSRRTEQLKAPLTVRKRHGIKQSDCNASSLQFSKQPDLSARASGKRRVASRTGEWQPA